MNQPPEGRVKNEEIAHQIAGEPTFAQLKQAITEALNAKDSELEAVRGENDRLRRYYSGNPSDWPKQEKEISELRAEVERLLAIPRKVACLNCKATEASLLSAGKALKNISSVYGMTEEAARQVMEHVRHGLTPDIQKLLTKESAREAVIEAAEDIDGSWSYGKVIKLKEALATYKNLEGQ